MPVTQPAVSQHLAVLRRARLVTEQREGRRHLYSLDPAGLIAVRAWIDGFWDEILDAFSEKVLERSLTKESATTGGDHEKETD